MNREKLTSVEEFDEFMRTARRAYIRYVFGIGAFWFAVGWLAGVWL